MGHELHLKVVIKKKRSIQIGCMFFKKGQIHMEVCLYVQEMPLVGYKSN